MGRKFLRDPMGGDRELLGCVDRQCQAGVWPRDSCKFSTDESTRPTTRRGGNATTSKIFSKVARVSRTGRSAVHANNAHARSAQGRIPPTQCKWKRLLSSHVITDERCGVGPSAASLAPSSRAQRRASRVVVTREAWTGLILVATSKRVE